MKCALIALNTFAGLAMVAAKSIPPKTTPAPTAVSGDKVSGPGPLTFTAQHKLKSTSSDVVYKPFVVYCQDNTIFISANDTADVTTRFYVLEGKGRDGLAYLEDNTQQLFLQNGQLLYGPATTPYKPPKLQKRHTKSKPTPQPMSTPISTSSLPTAEGGDPQYQVFDLYKPQSLEFTVFKASESQSWWACPPQASSGKADTFVLYIKEHWPKGDKKTPQKQGCFLVRIAVTSSSET